MFDHLTPFLIHWASTALSLWVASHVFRGIRFSDTSSLIISALLLGFANAIVRPLLIVLTLPLTIVTLGLFLLVINALMLLLVSSIVRGFTISGFWTAFFASLFIGLLSFAIGSWLDGDRWSSQPVGQGRWVEAPLFDQVAIGVPRGMRENRHDHDQAEEQRREAEQG